MPNWVYNNLTIEGNESDIAKLKAQMNTPFVDYIEAIGDLNYVVKEIKYSNPVFSFRNIIAPTDLEAYRAQPSVKVGEKIINNENSWYNWNIRNWGVKWDVAASDDDKYPETELYDEGDTSLSYRFNTAWGVAEQAIKTLTTQYPNLEFILSFEEEGGWGGEWVFENGEYTITSEYGWKCRDCDHEEDETPWCDDCEFDICPSCGYNESSEPCDEHKEKDND
jgi:hypothetical protein